MKSSIIIKGKGEAAKKVAALHLYGEVYPYHSKDASEMSVISLTTVQDEIKSLGGVEAFDEVLVRIDSGGGDVDEGLGIYNYLLSLGKPITTIADGACHSIASVIFLAGSVRKIYATTQPIIHNPWTIAVGNADQLSDVVEVLRMKEELVLDLYVKRTGGDRNTIEALMADDKPMTAEQFKELGFATEILEPVKAYAVISITPQPKKQNDMSLKSIKDKIIALFAEADSTETPAIVNKVFTTTDGTKLDIATGDDGEIKEGQAATIDGAAAPDKDYVLEDGRTVSVMDGKVSAVKEKEAEQDNADADAAAASAAASSLSTEVVVLKAQVSTLSAQVKDLAIKDQEIATLKATVAEQQKDAEEIYEIMKKMKVEAKIPSRTGLIKKEEPKEKTKEEISASVADHLAKKKRNQN